MAAAKSKRIKSFRLSIAKQVPKFPNDKETLNGLEWKSLPTLLLHYTNWAIRYVAPRPRTVHVETAVRHDPRWESLSTAITAFLSKVEDAKDLTPHLSLEPTLAGILLLRPRRELR